MLCQSIAAPRPRCCFPLETAEFVCGPDGLAGAGLPAASRQAAPGHAVEAIIALLGPRPMTASRSARWVR
jgi:inosine-uridine nucleoside N-ribohydrolase